MAHLISRPYGLLICHVMYVEASCVSCQVYAGKIQDLDHLLIMILKTIRCRERDVQFHVDKTCPLNEINWLYLWFI